LPNLSQIRRPSKSSIVNSSIAHINASRRHRLLASRELRLLKLESDALRRELNEWRDRASLPRLEEPIRSEGFAVVLSGELETLPATPEEEELHNYDGYEDPDDDLVMVNGSSSAEDGDETGLSQAFNANPTNALKTVNSPPFTHGLPSGDNGFSQIALRSSLRPAIASNPPSVSFENPAISSFYEAHPEGLDGNMLFIPQQQQQQQQQRAQEIEKALWTSRVFMNDSAPSQLQLLQSRSFPISAANSASGTTSLNTFVDSPNQNYFTGLQRSPPQLHSIQPMGHVYASPEDDASSVGSGRPSSGSSARYSSPLASPVTYDLASPCDTATDFGVSRRLSAGSIQLPSVHGWCRPTEGLADNMGIMKQNIISPIAGSGRGYLTMV
jgi:hypothetical protein